MGLGRKLLTKALTDLREDGIRGIQLTFPPELEGFYRSVGFSILSGGLIDFKHMEWNPNINS